MLIESAKDSLCFSVTHYKHPKQPHTVQVSEGDPPTPVQAPQVASHSSGEWERPATARSGSDELRLDHGSEPVEHVQQIPVL